MPLNGESFTARLSAIDWTKWETAYGPAANVPSQLESLMDSRDLSERQNAAHALWCGLCHQLAYVSSAAVPTLPFLLEILDRADDATAVEILDILVGFAWCTRPNLNPPLPDWAAQLRNRLAEELPRFRQLAGHQNQEISAFCERILEAYGEVCPIEHHGRPPFVAKSSGK